jgi:hypothetical protein
VAGFSHGLLEFRHGTPVEFLLTAERDLKAAKRFYGAEQSRLLAFCFGFPQIHKA